MTGVGRSASRKCRVGRIREPVEPQFDELGAALRQRTVLRDDHLVTSPTDDDADHVAESYPSLPNCRSNSVRVKTSAVGRPCGQ